jgi:hypothetical protein
MIKIIAFCIIVLSHANIYASAWLLEEGRYRYSCTANSVDKKSIAERKKREAIARYLSIEQAAASEYIQKIKPHSQKHKIITTYSQALKKLISELTAYQDNGLIECGVEYGISDNQNFGIHLLYQQNKFKTKETLNRETSVFYKLRLLHDNAFVVSIQPKILINKDQGCSENFFAEVSLLSGLSHDISWASIFNQNVLSFGHYINYQGYKKRYYNFSISEGIKFKNNWMLVNFTKYNAKQGYGYIYEKSIYEQLSIAKIINIDNIRKNSLTVQLGYFWDYSLINKKYKVSGVTFSIWLDI